MQNSRRDGGQMVDNDSFELADLSKISWCFTWHLRDVGHGGALVEAMTFNRRVVGSTPALAAM